LRNSGSRRVRGVWIHRACFEGLDTLGAAKVWDAKILREKTMVVKETIEV
jgi:hypothetical protein